MNYHNLCFGCMENKGSSPACPYCGFLAEAAPEALLHLPPGTELQGKFLLGRALGQGGFGITYLAWDMTLNIKLAIKEYMPQQLATRSIGQSEITVVNSTLVEEFHYGRKKFLEEARTLARFAEHPNIVTVRDYFEANNTAYMVMSYVEGVTFAQYLDSRGGRIGLQQTLEIVMPVLDALKDIHKAGIMHRDISPDNILIDRSGRVLLIDFGAARQQLVDNSKSMSVILKAGYAPLEQYSSKGEQGPWSDVYAIAATTYRAITGLMPPESIERIVKDTLIAPSQAGVAGEKKYEELLLKALAVKVEDRYRSVEDFQKELLKQKNLEEQEISIKAAQEVFLSEGKRNSSKSLNHSVPRSFETTPKKHKSLAKAMLIIFLGIAIGLSLFSIKDIAGFFYNHSMQNELINYDLDSAETTGIVEARGNSVGNIVNVGIAAQEGEWVYHRKNDQQGALYKTNIYSGEQVKLNDDDSWNINVLGEWLYYSNSAERWNIYRIGTDGKNRSRLNADDSGNLNVVGDWIYYRNDDENGSIYKIRTDGSERTRLNNEQSYYLNVVYGWVYFQNRNDGGSLYKIRTDGTDRAKLNSDDTWHLNVVDGWVYYCAANEGWNIFRVRLDGSERTRINDDKSANLNLHNGWLYYRNDDDGSNLYKIRPDGTQKTRINNDKTFFFSITDSWIYYQNRSDNEKIYRMEIDGSSRQPAN